MALSFVVSLMYFTNHTGFVPRVLAIGMMVLTAGSLFDSAWNWHRGRSQMSRE